MFEIELFDRAGEKLISKEIRWNSLPTVGQKIIVAERGNFLVTKVSIFIDEDFPSEPTYLVSLEKEIGSSPEDFGAMS